MSNWISITTADLDDTKVAALVEALGTAALGGSQDNPIDETIASVVARIRAEVAQCERNQVDADTTKIPASLKRLACRMVIFELMGRLQLALTDDERDERRADERLLVRVSKCELPVETPDSAVAPDVQKGSTISVVTSTTRQATRAKMAGL